MSYIPQYGFIINNNNSSTFSNEEIINFSFKESLNKIKTDLKLKWFNEPNNYNPKQPNEIYKDKIPLFNEIENYLLVDPDITDGNSENPIPKVTNITVNQVINQIFISSYKLSDILNTDNVRNNSNYLNLTDNDYVDGSQRKQIKKLSRNMFTRYSYWKNQLTGKRTLLQGGLEDNITINNSNHGTYTNNSDENNSNTNGNFEPFNAMLTYQPSINNNTLSDARVWDNINLKVSQKNNSNEKTFYQKLIQFSKPIPIIHPDFKFSDDPLSKVHPFLEIYVQVPLYSTISSDNAINIPHIVNNTGENTNVTVSDNIGFTNPVLEKSLGDNYGFTYKIMGYNSNNWQEQTNSFGEGNVLYFLNNPGFVMVYGIGNIAWNQPLSARYPPIVSFMKYKGETLMEGFIKQVEKLPEPILYKNNDLIIDTSENMLFRLNDNGNKEWVNIGGKFLWFNNKNDVYNINIGNVGIGKNNPSYKFDVSGNINFSGDILKNGILYDTSKWTISGENIYNINSGFIGIGKNNPLYKVDITGDINITGNIYKDGSIFNTSKWTISGENIYNMNNGFVGINNNNPLFNLDISGDINLTGNLYKFGNLGININNPKYSLDLSGDLNLTGNLYKKGFLGINKNDPLYNLDVSGNINISGEFLKNGVIYDTSKWTISGENIYNINSGNIGIGKTNPNYKLDVSGDINITGNIFKDGSIFNTSKWGIINDNIYNINTGNVGIGLTNPLSVFNINSNNPEIFLQPKNNTQTASLSFRNSENNKTKASVRYNYHNNSMNINVNETNKVNIINGNIGIDKDSPNYKLDVSGDINFTGNIYKDGIIYNTSKWNANNNNIYNINFGNIGIGKNNPSFKLDIAGDINFTGGIFRNGVPFKNETPTLIEEVLFRFEQFIGVGNQFPNYRLDVDGDINYSGNFYQNGELIDFVRIKNLEEIVFGSENVFGMKSILINLVDYTSNSWQIKNDDIFYDLGFIGIGTTEPNYKLHIEEVLNKELALKIRNKSSGINSYSLLSLENDKLDQGLIFLLNSSNRNLDGGANNATIRNNSGSLLLQASGGINGIYILKENGNIGIGTTIPESLLHINKTSNYPEIYINQTNGQKISIGTNTLGSYIGYSDYLSLGNINGSQFNNFNEKIRILNNGNVGIGITNPLSILNINSTNPEIFLQPKNDNEYSSISFRDSTNTTSKGYLKYDFSANSMTFNVNDIDRLHIINNGNVGIGITNPNVSLEVNGDIHLSGSDRTIYNRSNNFLAFGTNNTERIRILNNGNVGIGITNPLSILNINSTNPEIFLQPKNDNEYSSISFRDSTNTTSKGYLKYDFSDNSMKFNVNDIDRLHIINNGNVGIGITNPNVSLEVNGDIHLSGSDRTIYNRSNNFLAFGTNNTERIRILNNGNVGIGITNPLSILNINSTNPEIFLQPKNDNEYSSISFRDSTNTTSKGYLKYDFSANSMTFNVNDIDRLHIINNGNVGIGTTNPTYKLDVYGRLFVSESSSSTIIIERLSNDSGPAEMIARKARIVDGKKSAVLQNDRLWFFAGAGYIGTEDIDGSFTPNKVGVNFVASEDFTTTNQGTHITFETTNLNSLLRTEKMRIIADGNVGIGTTNPVTKLQVEGDTIIGTTSSTSLIINDIAKAKWRLSTGGYDLLFSQHTGDTNNDYSNWAPRMVLQNNGNIGIDNTNPSYRLDVSGDINFSGRLLQNGMSYGSSTESINDLENIIYGTNEIVGIKSLVEDFNDYMLSSWNFNGSNLFYNNGNVGIGVQTPNAKLDIDGNTTIPLVRAIRPSGSSETNGIVTGDGGGLIYLYAGATYSGLTSTTQGTTKIVLKAGNVGIGTTNPETNLDVNGEIILRTYSTTGVSKGIYFRPGFTGGSYNTSILTYDHNQNGLGPTDGLSINGFDGVSICTGSNTRQERLRITDNGNVGVGTTNPGNFKLNVDGIGKFNSLSIGSLITTHGVTPNNNGQTSTPSLHIINSENANGTSEVVRLEKWCSNDIVAASAGHIGLYLNDINLGGGEVARIMWKDGQTGNADPEGTGELSFWTSNTGNADGIPEQRMTIKNNGNVGIGLTNPTTALHVNGAITLEAQTLSSPEEDVIDLVNKTNTYIKFARANTGSDLALLRQIGGDNNITLAFDFHDDGNDACFAIRDVTSTANPDTINTRFFVNGRTGTVGIGTNNPGHALHVVGNIFATGNITAFSDKNYKENIIKLENTLNDIQNINGVYYNFIGSNQRNIGLIAQEVEKIYPELIITGSDNKKALNYQNMVAILLEAIKEINNKFEKIKEENDTLKLQVKLIMEKLNI